MMARLKMETLLVVNLSGLEGYRNSFGRSLANFEIQWLGFSGNIIQDKVKPTILSARPFNVLFQAKRMSRPETSIVHNFYYMSFHYMLNVSNCFLENKAVYSITDTVIRLMSSQLNVAFL